MKTSIYLGSQNAIFAAICLTVFILAGCSGMPSNDSNDANLLNEQTTSDLEDTADDPSANDGADQESEESEGDTADDLTDDPEDDSADDLTDGPEDDEQDDPVEPDPSTPLMAETCADAPTLSSASSPVTGPAAGFQYQLLGTYGDTDDYNPYQGSDKEPGCSLVFDAMGKEVVYSIDLRPGQTFQAELVLVGTSVGALYLMTDCSAGTWPDIDESGMCGSNEYASQGYCAFDCEPLDWSFTWPMYQMNGEENVEETFYLVIDEVGNNTAAQFELSWSIENAQ
jgi:hypothetical protein